MKAVLIAFAMLSMLGAGTAQAQAYPARPVRIMVGYVPGGGVDTTARLVAAALSGLWGSNVLVENRPGAAGNIATEYTARAAPDGYTLVLCNIGSHSITPARFRKRLTYDPIADFAFPAMIGGVPNVLMVHPSMPMRSLREFVAYAKAHPGKLNFGSSGVGGSPHLSIELFKMISGIDIVHVPYKGGVPQVTALVSGETQSSLATISTVITHIRNGRLRPLGVSSAKPSKTLPGIPTIAESGVPGYEMAPWIGVFAPAGTPKNIVDRLNAEVNKALAQPDIVQKLEAQALDPWPSTPQELDARLKTDFDKYAKLIRMSGAKIE